MSDAPKRSLTALESKLAELADQARGGFAERARALRAAADLVASGGAPDELRRLAHQVRGIAGSVGHPELSERAAELEALARDGAPDELEEAARGLAGALEAVAPARPRAPRRELGWRVLVVDDDPAMRRLVALALEQGGGCTVEVSGEPDRALASLERGRFDLMLVDAMMPDKNGLEVYREARALRPELPIAILSAAEPDELGWQLPDDVRLTWLRKPFRAAALLDELGALLARARG